MVIRLVAWRNGARVGRLTGLLGVAGVANLCGEKLEQGSENARCKRRFVRCLPGMAAAEDGRPPHRTRLLKRESKRAEVNHV